MKEKRDFSYMNLKLYNELYLPEIKKKGDKIKFTNSVKKFKESKQIKDIKYILSDYSDEENENKDKKEEFEDKEEGQ